MALTR